MRRLLEFFVERSLIVNGVTIGVILLGLATFVGMSRHLVPPLAINLIVIDGNLPGASAVDTEQFLTFPIEEAVSDLAGVKKVESVTRAGRSSIKVFFEPAYDDIAGALETIRSRVDQLRPRLPTDLRPLTIRQFKQDRVDFMDLAIAPIDEANPEHRTWIRSLSERIDKIPHIVAVESSLPEQDLYVEFDRAKVDAAGVDVAQIKRKIFEHLAFEPVGEVKSDFQRVSVELRKGFDGIEALERLPITRNRMGEGLNLGDVAAVTLKSRDRFVARRLDGKRFVQLELFKDTQSDIIELEARIREEVAAFNRRAPPELEARVLGSASLYIERPLSVVMVNGLAGLFIVGLVLFAFLGFRIAAMAVVGLPFVYLGTFVAIDALGIEIHLVSVIGLLLVLGILVDDAILVSERFLENLQAGLQPRAAAIEAAATLLRPVTGTIVTNIVVFAPILFIKSELSTVFFAVPIVVISTLLLSLFESFFILPNHLVHFVPENYVFKERRPFLWAQRVYRKILGWSLRLRYLSVLFFLLLFGVAGYLLTVMKKDFNLSLGTERVYVHAVASEATTLEETLAAGARLEAKIRQGVPAELIEYVEITAGETRVPGGHRLYGRRELEVSVVVDEEAEDNKATAVMVEGLMKTAVAEVKGFERLEVFRKTEGRDKEKDVVTIYVSGGDTLSFEAIQDKIRTEITDLADVDRVFMDPNRFQQSWQYVPNIDQLAIYGVEQAQLTQHLRQHFSPQELLRLRHEGQEITAYTRFAHSEDFSYEELAGLTVMTPRGIPVELSQLGTWERRQVLKEINHRDLLRKFEIDVAYDSDKVTHEQIEESLDNKLEGLRTAYPQYTITVKPPEEAEAAKKWIAKVLIACLVVIFLTLVFVLDSLVQPLLVMFAIPFGFTGVVLAFWSHGMPLGLMGMIGLIGLTGVVVNDSLVMVDTVNEVYAKSQDPSAFLPAVQDGAVSRFKAVVLTSLTTLGGVFPLAYGIGGKAGWTQPMVFALGWGLLFATLLTLFLLPNTLAIIWDVKRLLRFLVSRLLRRGGGAE